MIFVAKDMQRQLKSMGFTDANIPLMWIGLCDITMESGKVKVLGETIEYED